MRMGKDDETSEKTSRRKRGGVEKQGSGKEAIMVGRAHWREDERHRRREKNNKNIKTYLKNAIVKNNSL